jgi:predicted secreted protein
MAVEGITGVGTVFRRWNTGTSAWENIGGITNIGGPSSSRETHDTTALDTEGGYRTFITGFRDGGEITLDMIFDRAGYDLMLEDFESDKTGNYEIVLPDDDVTSCEIEGLVTGIPLTIPEGPVTVSVTIKISGKPTINSGSYSGSPL